MARPIKETVDYFPHSCNHKKTIFILESKFGNDGYAFWFKLLELLGSTKKHYLNYQPENESDWEFLQAKTHLDGDKCNKILNLLAKVGAIDNEMWGKRIVWSDNFINNIADAYKNRRQEVPQKPSFYEQKLTTKGISTDNNPNKVEFSAQPTDRNPQKKLKETKVNKNKEGPPIVPPKKIQTKEKNKTKHSEFVFMTESQYNTLIQKYGKEKTSLFIKKLNNYKGEKGIKYESDYHAILKWVVDVVENELNNKQKFKDKQNGHHDPNLIKDVIHEQIDYLEAENQDKKNQYRIWFEKKYGKIVMPVSANIVKGTSEKEGNEAYYLFDNNEIKRKFKEFYLENSEMHLKQPYMDLALKQLIEVRGGLKKVNRFNSFEFNEFKNAYISMINGQ